MTPRTKLTVAYIAGAIGLVVLAGAVVALVLGISVRGRMPAEENPHAVPAQLAIALGIVGIATSTAVTFWLLV